MDYTTSARLIKPHFIETVYPAIRSTPSEIRSEFEQALTDWDIAVTPRIEDFLLAIGEAAANSVKHGSRSEESSVLFRAKYDAECPALTVEICDSGSGFDESIPFRVDNIDEIEVCASGRYMMTRLSDSLTYSHGGGWFVCQMTKKL